MALVIGLVWLAAACAATAADDFSVGQRVMLKENAQPQVGTQKLDWGAVPLPATVEQVKGDWLWLGGAWVKRGQVVLLDDAPAYYTELIRGNARHVDAYVLRGVSWMEKREFDNAIKDLSEAIRLLPDKSLFYTVRGKAYFAKHLYEAAISDYTEAIRLDPKNLIAYNDRSVTWNRLGEFHKAEEQLNEVLRMAPDNALAYANRGANWFDQDEYGKALADLNRAIELDPKMSAAYANRGRLCMKLGNYVEANEDYDRSMKLAPHEWPAYNGRARIYATAPEFEFHLRDGKKALALAKKACELSKWSEWMCIATLAAAYAELGDFESAVRWQKKAMEMSQPAKPRDQADNEKRLALYKAGKPYYEEVAKPQTDEPPAPEDAEP